MTKDAADNNLALIVRIEGRVQGVWFRGWTVEEARLRGLAGWVRNRPDGSVQALFSGPRRQVEDMMAACYRGPPAARVTDVVSEAGEPPAEAGFHQRPTG
jgi:acylphosphatase